MAETSDERIMPKPLARLLRRVANRFLLDAGLARRHFEHNTGRVRILAYHGLVPDAFADRPWVPSHYVTVAQFERQMDLLAELGRPIVQPLGTALDLLRTSRPLQRPVVCLTFDDGMADDAELALPILERHGFTATFFLATGHIDTEALQANDIIRLLKHAIASGRVEPPTHGVCRSLLTQPSFNKSTSALAYRSELEAFWQASQAYADPDGIRAMSMMSWDQARRLRDAGMEIGAHTVDHVILSRETDLERRRQIESSIQAVKTNLNLDAVPFSYPNGQPEDFGGADLAVLQELNVPYAATTIPGWNDATTPRLALRRTCIGLHHSDRAFLAAVFGLLDQPTGALERKSA